MSADIQARTGSRLREPLAVVGVIVAALSLGAYLGRWWWLLDVAASFRFQLALTAAGVVVGAVALRSGVAGLVGVVAVAANLFPIAPLYVGPSAGEIPSQLRVASYNLLASATQERAEVVGWLAEVDADVIFLHEANHRWTRFIDRAGLDYELIGPELSFADPFGTMALVRDAASATMVDVIHRPSPLVTVEVNGQAVSILGIHALSPYGSARSAVRDADLLDVAAWAQAQDNPVVVAGDFNSTPFSWAFREMLGRSALVNSMDGFGLQPTWPTSNLFLRIPIDHLVHSPGLVTVDRTVPGSFGSDHFPVVVDLALAPTR